MRKIQDKSYNDNLCLFRALALHLHGTQRLEGETSKIFNLFINKMDGMSADQFRGFHMNDIPFVEDLLTLNIVMYDIDIVDDDIIGELARRSLQKSTIMSDCWCTIVIHVIWATLLQSFKLFVLLIVTISSTEISIWSDFYLHEANEWKKSIRGTYIKSEKVSVTSWNPSVSSTQVNKNFLKT